MMAAFVLALGALLLGEEGTTAGVVSSFFAVAGGVAAVVSCAAVTAFVVALGALVLFGEAVALITTIGAGSTPAVFPIRSRSPFFSRLLTSSILWLVSRLSVRVAT
jgi:hypothetical protein